MYTREFSTVERRAPVVIVLLIAFSLDVLLVICVPISERDSRRESNLISSTLSAKTIHSNYL